MIAHELSSLVPKSEDIAIIKRRENIAPIYVWLSDDEAIEKIVLPIRGYGLWGTLYGYLSLDSDLNTVKGIEYYEHKETPRSFLMLVILYAFDCI